MRLPRVAAGAALTAMLALVTIPAGVGSWTSRQMDIDRITFRPVEVGDAAGTVTVPTPDPRARSAAVLDPAGRLVDPAPSRALEERPNPQISAAAPIVVLKQPRVRPSSRGGTVSAGDGWNLDRHVSWFGPGWYGSRTACGQTYTQGLAGVAHRTLPCGTLVTFRNVTTGAAITVPVVDRGPYIAGRNWDLTAAACGAIGACRTGPLYWRLGG